MIYAYRKNKSLGYMEYYTLHNNSNWKEDNESLVWRWSIFSYHVMTGYHVANEDKFTNARFSTPEEAIAFIKEDAVIFEGEKFPHYDDLPETHTRNSNNTLTMI